MARDNQSLFTVEKKTQNSGTKHFSSLISNGSILVIKPLIFD